MDKVIETLNSGIENSKIERERVCLVTDIPYDPKVTDFLYTVKKVEMLRQKT